MQACLKKVEYYDSAAMEVIPERVESVTMLEHNEEELEYWLFAVHLMIAKKRNNE